MGRSLVFGVLGLVALPALAQEGGAPAVEVHRGTEGEPTEAAPPAEVAAEEVPAEEAPTVEVPDEEWEAELEPEPEPAPAPVAAAAAASEVRTLAVKSSKPAVFPDELAVLHKANTVRCEARVWVDSKGAPERIVLTECPDGLHLSALEALGTWRWEKPSGYVPAGGVETTASTAFERRNKNFYPGVTYFRSPEEVSGDGLEVTIKGGKMPRFPRAVVAGDDVCLVELVVDGGGKVRSALVEECTLPYEAEMKKAVKSWTFWWNKAPAKGQTATVVTEVVFRI